MAPERQIEAFNPLHPKPLGESVALALAQQPCYPLPPDFAFEGAGVYAIYYSGDATLYRPIAEKNRSGCEQPIYFGKAEPEGRRKGNYSLDAGKALYGRLTSDHAASIRDVEANTSEGEAGHLRLNDFTCRFLVVEPVWIPLIESLSITTLKPLWNELVSGFGHHDQGRTRQNQKRSFWDTLHPGRAWARDFAPNPINPETLAKVVEVWLANPALKLPTRPRGASEEIIAEILEAWLQDPVGFRYERWRRANRSRLAAQPQLELEEEPAEEPADMVELEGDDD